MCREGRVRFHAAVSQVVCDVPSRWRKSFHLYLNVPFEGKDVLGYYLSQLLITDLK